MSKYHVTTETLDQAARHLDEVRTQLMSLREVPAGDRDALGGTDAYTAFQEFSDAWHYGVQQIDSSVGGLATGLRQASENYKHGEATITAAATSHIGSTTGKGGGSAGGGVVGGAATGGAAGVTSGTAGASSADAKKIDAQIDRISDSRIRNNPSMKAFIAAMALTTGLNPVVIAAWVIQEGGSATGGKFNFLNIGNTDSEFYGTKDGVWTDPATAGKYSGLWLEGKYSLPGFGYASPGVQGISRSAGKSPEDQISAIQHSGWASSGEPLLPELYSEFSR